MRWSSPLSRERAALNLDGKIGTLTPGKEADLVLLRADDPTVWPVNNAPGTVVNIMNPGQIDAVFIAGKVRNAASR